jgi:lysozyme family protein
MFKNIKNAEQLQQEKLQRDYEQAVTAWKKQRQDAVDSILVEFEGKAYQGDEVSQTRMSRAISAMDDIVTVPWVAMDNTESMLSKAGLQTILAQAGIQQSTVWNQGRPVKPEGLE